MSDELTWRLHAHRDRCAATTVPEPDATVLRDGRDRAPVTAERHRRDGAILPCTVRPPQAAGPEIPHLHETVIAADDERRAVGAQVERPRIRPDAVVHPRERGRGGERAEERPARRDGAVESFRLEREEQGLVELGVHHRVRQRSEALGVRDAGSLACLVALE